MVDCFDTLEVVRYILQLYASRLFDYVVGLGLVNFNTISAQCFRNDVKCVSMHQVSVLKMLEFLNLRRFPLISAVLRYRIFGVFWGYLCVLC